MFAQAIQLLETCTMPVIITSRHTDGSLSSGCGTFIVLNKDGWILTAAHIIEQLTLPSKHKAEATAYENARLQIEQAAHIPKHIRKAKLRELKQNPKWVTHQAAMWGWPTTNISDLRGDPFKDIAVGRLLNFDPNSMKNYPVFKNPKEPMPPGTSLCRLGYPFHQINATFENGQFGLADGVLPVPRFPNDGIFTRNVNFLSPDKVQRVLLLETSTPGLRGQSGGPIFDIQGRVWALQSRTQSLPLGFAPEIQDGNRKIVEHQFMHVGWGTHVEEIVAFLSSQKVDFQISG